MFKFYYAPEGKYRVELRNDDNVVTYEKLPETERSFEFDSSGYAGNIRKRLDRDYPG